MNMNNNPNMNDLIKKAQEMIKNNQVPDDVKQFVNNMSSSSSPSTLKEQDSFDTESANTGSIDMNALMNMAQKLKNSASDDDMSRLLYALKPYLRNERKDRIDEYVKLVKMGKMAGLMDLFGGGKK